MANANLATYLNDHLAGSVVAIEMMEHLEKIQSGSTLASAIAELRAEVVSDRKELEALMQRHQIGRSTARKTMAWLTAKFAEIKLSVDDTAGGSLHLLEALEAIALGIDGKRALWRSLKAASVQGMPEADLRRLDERAQEQRDRMELLRLSAAQNALQDHDRVPS